MKPSTVLLYARDVHWPGAWGYVDIANVSRRPSEYVAASRFLRAAYDAGEEGRVDAFRIAISMAMSDEAQP